MNKQDLAKLTILAMHARENAYSPYSNHPVGVALVSNSGRVYLGSNVETAHYKAVCAEASAISAMTTAGERKIKAVVVIGPGKDYLCTPCGDCRQRLREFSDKNTRIYSMWHDGRLGKTHTIDKLLPLSFGRENVLEAGKKKTASKTKSKAKKKNKK